MRGGEYVLEAMAELFSRPKLFTLLYIRGAIEGPIAELDCTTSWLQHVPGASRHYRHFLPLMPQMVSSLDVSGFELVVSSSHCVAKGVRKAPEAVHVSYVHAPMRYMWERFDDYFGAGRARLDVRAAAHAFRSYLQSWDRFVSSADRVDVLIANSSFIADQIRRAYGREARVVHPFVDLSRFRRPRAPGPHYLMVGAFAPNKRVDLAVEAFTRLRLPLLIVGRGSNEARLRAMAGPTVKFLGPLSNRSIEELYATARAFVFPGVEDFGITPLEAMASGLPVIAYAAGGALETVVDAQSGLFFHQATVESLGAAVERIERGSVTFDEKTVRARANAFTKDLFQRGLLCEIRAAWAASGKPLSALEGALNPAFRRS